MNGDAPSSECRRFLELLQPIEAQLENYGRRLIWDPQDLPDALQNALLRAVGAFDRYRDGASFRAWMFQILTREVFALNRKHARRARFEFQLEAEEIETMAGAAGPSESETDPTPRPDELADSLDDRLVLALRLLTDNERSVLLLRGIAGFRYREIAETLEMPIGSVMGHLARARQKARAALARAARSSDPKRKP